MSLSARAIATAEKLLTKFGESGSLRHVTGTAYDPSTGSNVETAQTYAVKVYIAPVTSEDMEDSTVLRTDNRFILSVYGVVQPSVNDTITIDSVIYNVQSSLKIKVSGQSVLYKGIVRV